MAPGSPPAQSCAPGRPPGTPPLVSKQHVPRERVLAPFPPTGWKAGAEEGSKRSCTRLSSPCEPERTAGAGEAEGGDPLAAPSLPKQTQMQPGAWSLGRHCDSDPTPAPANRRAGSAALLETRALACMIPQPRGLPFPKKNKRFLGRLPVEGAHVCTSPGVAGCGNGGRTFLHVNGARPSPMKAIPPRTQWSVCLLEECRPGPRGHATLDSGSAGPRGRALPVAPSLTAVERPPCTSSALTQLSKPRKADPAGAGDSLRAQRSPRGLSHTALPAWAGAPQVLAPHRRSFSVRGCRAMSRSWPLSSLLER